MQAIRSGPQEILSTWDVTAKFQIDRGLRMQDFIAELTGQTFAWAKDVPMHGKTSFKIGGPAEVMLYPASRQELQGCISLCAEHGMKPFIFGRGSNLLVKDSGLDGVVVSTERMQQLELLDEGLIFCEAGVKLIDLCVFAQKHGLSGLEFAYGIPGSVGGAVYMNAGAYGGEIKDVLHSVDFVEPDGRAATLPAAQLELGYRNSAFMKHGGVVTACTVQLESGNPAEIRAKMQETMQKRKDKQPLEFPSAGSVFKRPAGHYASALIEQCGLKGKSVGGAQVSEKHAGFIVNTGGAKAADVRALIALIQTVVEQECNVRLEPEIHFV
jgi:UDP-N-acetylmuramate dehydrogenase